MYTTQQSICSTVSFLTIGLDVRNFRWCCCTIHVTQSIIVYKNTKVLDHSAYEHVSGSNTSDHCFLEIACFASSGVTMTTFFFSAASSSRLAFIWARSSVSFWSFSFLSFSRRSRRDSITSLAQTSSGAFSTYSLPVEMSKERGCFRWLS